MNDLKFDEYFVSILKLWLPSTKYYDSYKQCKLKQNTDEVVILITVPVYS